MTELVADLERGSFIGKGHFGAVYSGKDRVHGPVAIKVIEPDPTKPAAEWSKRKSALLLEGQRLKAAEHRNIVRVYQLLDHPTDDYLSLVMELCTGGSLQSNFDKGPVPINDVRKIATDVCMGLEAIHSRGMLHRDIKPANILRDDRGTIKIGDFGLVTDDIILGYAAGAGYNDHLAPETMLGYGTSVRSDIWALGITVFRMLHGAEWYKRTPVPRTVVPGGGFADQLVWLPHVPKDWKRFVRHLLRDDPKERPQNISQVLSGLSKLSIQPSWQCSLGINDVRWNFESKKRRFEVIATEIAGANSEWKATSLPIGKGKVLVLGKSHKPQKLKDTLKQLSDFFVSRK